MFQVVKYFRCFILIIILFSMVNISCVDYFAPFAELIHEIYSCSDSGFDEYPIKIDDNLRKISIEKYLRDMINKPDGTLDANDFKGIKILFLEKKGITDIKGIELCSDLEDLELFGNYVQDISPLSALKNLKILDLDFNSIEDLKPIELLTNLEILNLQCTNIHDVQYLSKLRNIRILILDENPISDLSPLSELTSLEMLKLCDTRVKDLEPISKLINLRRLDASGYFSPYIKHMNYEIPDISALRNLTNLEYLNLSYNKISDIRPLICLNKLKELKLDENIITDISPIASMDSLEVLTIRHNGLSNIEPLKNLKNIKKLSLSRNDIIIIEPLSDLYSLEELDLWSNKIENISHLAKLRNIRYINLFSNNINTLKEYINDIGANYCGKLKIDITYNPIDEKELEIEVKELEKKGIIVISDLSHVSLEEAIKYP